MNRFCVVEDSWDSYGGVDHGSFAGRVVATGAVEPDHVQLLVERLPDGRLFTVDHSLVRLVSDTSQLYKRTQRNQRRRKR